MKEILTNKDDAGNFTRKVKNCIFSHAHVCITGDIWKQGIIIDFTQCN